MDLTYLDKLFSICTFTIIEPRRFYVRKFFDRDKMFGIILHKNSDKTDFFRYQLIDESIICRVIIFLLFIILRNGAHTVFTSQEKKKTLERIIIRSKINRSKKEKKNDTRESV